MTVPIRVKESNRYGRLEPARLSAFERALGSALPPSFREHLLAHNGGRIEGAREVRYGFGLHDHVSTSLRLPGEYGGLLPSHMLPVAESQGGDLFCLSLSDRDRGAVFLWDHEGGGEGAGNFQVVAQDFDAFLRGLAISAALELQQNDIVEAAVAELGIDAVVLSGKTMLDMALRCEEVSHALIERLVSAGARISPDGLIEAVRVGRLATVQLMVNQGLDVNFALPDTGFTALMLAASGNALEIAEYLLRKGALPGMKNIWSKTAAELAHTPQMRELLNGR